MRVRYAGRERSRDAIGSADTCKGSGKARTPARRHRVCVFVTISTPERRYQVRHAVIVDSVRYANKDANLCPRKR
jgi:hypothetical protein